MSIFNIIEEKMKEKGITAYRMQKDIGINQNTYANWKNGCSPSADKLQKIIPYLGVTPNELFGYETPPELTENEREALELFQKLPEREQIKYIARLEDAVEKYRNEIEVTDKCHKIE